MRTKLRALAAAMANMSLSGEEERFVDALVSYFPDGTLEDHSWYAVSDSERLLKQLEYFSDDQNVIVPIRSSIWLSPDGMMTAAGMIQSMIEHLIDDHRRKWSFVCEAYAPLKIAAADRK